MRESILALVPSAGPGLEVRQVVRRLEADGQRAAAAEVQEAMRQLAEEGRLRRIGSYWWGR